MKTSLDLLNQIIGLGFDQQKSLIKIDRILDKELGIEGRKPLLDEKLSDSVYNEILGIFVEEARQNKRN